MNEEKLTTIIFRARPIVTEMMEKLKEKRGYGTNAECIRAAIVDHYESYFKEYGKDALSIKQPKLTKEQKLEEKAHAICMELNGDVITNANGNKACEYKIYEKVNPKLVNTFGSTIPFDMLTQDHITNQYSPNRQEVEQVLELNNQNL